MTSMTCAGALEARRVEPGTDGVLELAVRRMCMQTLREHVLWIDRLDGLARSALVFAGPQPRLRRVLAA